MTEAVTDPDAVFERRPIIDLFGDSSTLRALSVLVDGAGVPLPVSDIAEQAGVEPQTVYNTLDPLIEYGFVEEADKVGNATRYRAVMDSSTTQALMGLMDEMTDQANGTSAQ